ncbi:MAG: hypothetical protein PHG73_05905 [Pygmaiobacter sp.]|nr:hypothetical protein [Pygmaiobacter sp.]
MDRTISLAGAALNFAGVLGFAAAMLFLPVGFSYFFSILIAWGLVLMLAGFARTAPAGRTVAATSALVFGGMYALCNSIVYFVQLSVVATTPLDAQAAALLDFQQFGMFFSLDLLGYGLMALCTFFAGLALAPTRREEAVLRWLLIAHGAFAPACFILPPLGVFSASMPGASWVGTVLLEFWCLYFLPVGLLSLRYFARRLPAPAAAPVT